MKAPRNKQSTPAEAGDALGLGLMTLKVKRLDADATLPQYASGGAACFDLHACVHESPRFDDARRDVTVEARSTDTVGTGLAFEVPAGHVMLIFSRSGHGFNHGVRLSNCVGVIDSDYRGEVKVALHNDRRRDFLVRHGDRIAQAMIVPVPSVQFEEVEELSSTARGAGGLGSTGR